MVKNFNRFVKESVENKGVGPGNQDLFPSAPKRQTINRSNQTMDFLRVGKHIFTKKIDGFIDSVQNENIFITDRITGELRQYSLKEVLKELTQKKDDKNTSSTVQGFQGTPAWAVNQKIYEDSGFDPDKYEFEQDDDTVTDLAQELKYGIDDDGEEEDDIDDVRMNNEIGLDDPERNRMLYGTEDNPEGLPNKGMRREMPNENWVRYWEKFNDKQNDIYLEDESEDVEEEEEEFPLMRGTEDNPLPDRKRRPIIESYD